MTLELAAADAALLQAAAAADHVPLPEWIARTAVFVAETTSQPVAAAPATPAGTTPAEEPPPDARVGNDWSVGRRRPNF